MSAPAALFLFDPEGAVAGRRRFRMMLRMLLERWDTRRDGPLTEAALQQKLEGLGYEVGTRLYPAGAVSASQSETRRGVFAVAHGLVKVTLDGESVILGPGDLAFVPGGAVRRIEPIGPGAALCFEGLAPLPAA